MGFRSQWVLNGVRIHDLLYIFCAELINWNFDIKLDISTKHDGDNSTFCMCCFSFCLIGAFALVYKISDKLISSTKKKNAHEQFVIKQSLKID